MNPHRIIFAGTPDFALASLRALVMADLAPIAVLTQPDRPAGRGKKVAASAVKHYAVEHGLTVMQPPSLRDDATLAELRSLQPDIMIVAAYGLILPQSVLDIPRSGCLNVHASLLPRWRGAAPIQAAIMAGDTDTGVCLMAMEAGLDTGPVYACKKLRIGDRETAGELHDRLAAAGGELLVSLLPDILAGGCEAEPQDDSQATYAPKIQPAEARLEWSRNAGELERRVRAFNPVPGAWFMLGDERIKCWQARADVAVDARPGTVTSAGPEGVVVACGDGALRLERLQRPGKRAVTAGEFAAQVAPAGQRL